FPTKWGAKSPVRALCRRHPEGPPWQRQTSKTNPSRSSPTSRLFGRAREHLDDGALGTNYIGDPKKTVEILQSVLATEIVCVLRYTAHAVTASGISSEGVKAEFAEHAKEEQEHMMMVAERINQLGGKPNFNPEGITTRSASQFTEGANLVDM